MNYFNINCRFRIKFENEDYLNPITTEIFVIRKNVLF